MCFIFIPCFDKEYFQRFLSSPDFMNYLMNTLKLSAYGLLWGFPVPIILALLLNRIRKAGIRKKIQLLIYAPNFISVIVLCGMIRMFLSPVGPINQVLGIDTNWMTMPESFRTIYIARQQDGHRSCILQRCQMRAKIWKRQQL